MKKKIKDVHSLKSTAEETGKYADHIIGFENGDEKTFEDIDNSSIKVGRFTKMKHRDKNIVFGVQHKKVNWFEVHGKD